MTVSLEAGLVGRDEQALCVFYTDGLGFTLVARLAFDVGIVCRFRRSAARLKIFVPRDPVDPAGSVVPWFRPGGWRYAALAVEQPDDVDTLTDASVAAGGSVLIAPTNHRPGARMAMITDPEGNAWEILAEHDDAPEDGAP